MPLFKSPALPKIASYSSALRLDEILLKKTGWKKFQVLKPII